MCRQLVLLLSAWIFVSGLATQAKAQAIVELSGADKVEINYGLKQYGEKRLSPTTFAMNRKTRLAVQRALNGIGYSVGRPDGKSITVSFTVGSQQTFQLWSVAAKRKLAEVPVAGGYALPVFKPDSSILFVDSQSQQFSYYDTRTGETVSNPFRVDDYRIGYNRIYDETGVPIEYDFTRSQNQVWRALPTDTKLATFATGNLPKTHLLEIARDRIRYWDSGAGEN